MEKKDIASYSFEELQEEMLAIGEKGFRNGKKTDFKD